MHVKVTDPMSEVLKELVKLGEMLNARAQLRSFCPIENAVMQVNISNQCKEVRALILRYKLENFQHLILAAMDQLNLENQYFPLINLLGFNSAFCALPDQSWKQMNLGDALLAAKDDSKIKGAIIEDYEESLDNLRLPRWGPVPFDYVYEFFETTHISGFSIIPVCLHLDCDSVSKTELYKTRLVFWGTRIRSCVISLYFSDPFFSAVCLSEMLAKMPKLKRLVVIIRSTGPREIKYNNLSFPPLDELIQLSVYNTHSDGISLILINKYGKNIKKLDLQPFNIPSDSQLQLPALRDIGIVHYAKDVPCDVLINGLNKILHCPLRRISFCALPYSPQGTNNVSYRDLMLHSYNFKDTLEVLEIQLYGDSVKQERDWEWISTTEFPNLKTFRLRGGVEHIIPTLCFPNMEEFVGVDIGIKSEDDIEYARIMGFSTKHEEMLKSKMWKTNALLKSINLRWEGDDQYQNFYITREQIQVPE